MINPTRFSSRGFTLVEMAMVMMIIGLLLGGLIIPLSAQMDQRRATDTLKTLSEIREALFGYALINGQLPCPAKPTIATGDTDAGITDCTLTSGVVPWATLGTDETDAWGNRFTYRVDDIYTDSIALKTYGSGCSPPTTPATDPSQSSFALCSTGSYTVYSDDAATTTTALYIPAIIISHGKNSGGAYTQTGEQILPHSSNTGEADNSDDDTNNKYVSHIPTPDFDDLVVWIPNSILLNRMVAAGKLP
jgi:prepilin-type N-terminal cleavage/methylation domain-containing protein